MSRVQAINAMCKQCVYDPLERGTWRAQVAACHGERSCPLYAFRPLPRAMRVTK